MRKLANIWVPILLLVTILTTVYFRQWILTAREIGHVQEVQKNDIAIMQSARQNLQDLSSLQIALRVKLFGPAAAEEAVLSARPATGTFKTLPASVVSAMNRHGVRLVFYKQSEKLTQIQFEGTYDSLVRFIGSANPDLPRMDGFLMERSDKNSVKLTLTFAAAAV